MIAALQKCSKCGGRAFLDRSTLDEEAIDFVCINCGGRKYIKEQTPEWRFIKALEKRRRLLYG